MKSHLSTPIPCPARLRAPVPWRALSALSLLLASAPARAGDITAANETRKAEHAVSYSNDVVPDAPWSIHVVKIQRARRDFEFTTTLGVGDRFGMATVSEQLARLAPACGKPIVAINGDFYEKSEKYAGRPRDLQVVQGEVVSGPAGHTCFWLDREGNPRMTNVFSNFQVVWNDGTRTPLGLNEERKDDTAVLYTSAVGLSSRTSGGLELTLEAAPGTPCLPLRLGQLSSFRVKCLSTQGDSAITPLNPVLSLGPSLASNLPPPLPGSTLQLSTRTVPDLSAPSVAIGGGPALVRDHQLMHWDGFIKMRHPRTALGWNKEFIFLVEVDGRQSNLSVGMTFPELAEYMLKIGCDNAMNLDGGGSATLWFLGTVRNSPSEGQERPAANALVLVKKQPAAVPSQP